MSDEDDHKVYAAKIALQKAIDDLGTIDLPHAQIIMERVDDLINARLTQGVNLFNEMIEEMVIRLEKERP